MTDTSDLDSSEMPLPAPTARGRLVDTLSQDVTPQVDAAARQMIASGDALLVKNSRSAVHGFVLDQDHFDTRLEWTAADFSAICSCETRRRFCLRASLGDGSSGRPIRGISRAGRGPQPSDFSSQWRGAAGAAVGECLARAAGMENPPGVDRAGGKFACSGCPIGGGGAATAGALRGGCRRDA
jgi:hypothetical protein